MGDGERAKKKHNRGGDIGLKKSILGEGARALNKHIGGEGKGLGKK